MEAFVQCAPSQWRTTAVVPPGANSLSPAAQASLGDSAIMLSRSNENKPVALDHEVPSQCIKVELTALLLHDVLIPLQYCTIHASVGESTPTVRASPNAVSQPGVEAAAPVAETGLVTAVAGGDSATAPDSPKVR